MAATMTVGVERRSDFNALVWIEDATGTIVRGSAESVTDRGLRVRLAEKPGFAAGAVVALRLCLERGAPTVARTARVSWVRGGDESAECALEWA
jgi:hypothetical protein